MSGSRQRVLQVFKSISTSSCPAHSCSSTGAAKVTRKEYAFEIANSTLRFGPGVTREIGMDLINMGARNVLVVTDENIAKLKPMKTVVESLHKHKVKYTVFDKTRVEPTDVSFKAAINHAKAGDYDAYVAVGGGSVMDTCKAANLYASHPENDFLDFVNRSIGKGIPVYKKVKPLICVPTTSGTGSETTGVAIFDYLPLKVKTGIASREIKPTLGLVDSDHLESLPERVAVHSGFDVLCHALESFTAIPYQERDLAPENPNMRPAYQGSNPISDIWSLKALQVVADHFVNGVYRKEDVNARTEMFFASAMAGMGFGNAGVHLCHGLSYPISGLTKHYQSNHYPSNYSLIPHGLSVVITAPAVFKFTGPACPDRHLRAAAILGEDITNKKQADAGAVLADAVRKLMSKTKIENGIKALGYGYEDIPALVDGVIPQLRVTRLSPRQHTHDDLATIFENSMTVY